jgi:glycosyltransferase involved in cell wall biosynthesis
VASRLPGVRTVAEENLGALLVEPGNATDLAEKIKYLLDNPAVAERFGKYNYGRAKEKYSLTRNTEELISLYHRLR